MTANPPSGTQTAGDARPPPGVLAGAALAGSDWRGAPADLIAMPRSLELAERGPRGMKRIGEILVDAKAMTESTLERTLAFTKHNGVTFGTAVLEAGTLPEELLLRALSVQSSAPPASSRDLESIPPDVIGLVPGLLAQKHLVLPFRRTGRVLHLAMTCPWDNRAASEVEFLSGLSVVRHVALTARVVVALERYYGLLAPLRYRALVGRMDRSIAAAAGPALTPLALPADGAPARDRPLPSPPAPLAGIPPGSRIVPSDLSRAVDGGETFFETAGPDRPAGTTANSSRLAAQAAGPGSSESETGQGDLADLPRDLARAETRSEIGSTIMAFLGARLRSVALFVVEGDRLRGWMACPVPRSPFCAFSVGFSDLSAFSTLRDTTGFFAGPFPDTDTNRKILAALDVRFPAVIGVVPVTTCGKTRVYLLGEAAGGENGMPISLVRRCAALMATSLEILALRMQLRRIEAAFPGTW
jgi:hypothetical protein